MVEPNDPYKKLICIILYNNNNIIIIIMYNNIIQLRKKYKSGKGVIYVKPLQENLNLNVATDEEVSLFYSIFF